MQHIVELKDINMADIDTVGGKNASLGEMIQNLSNVGVKVPLGFATTVASYQHFLTTNDLDKRIYRTLANLNVNRVRPLRRMTHQIRRWIMTGEFSQEFIKEIKQAYKKFKNIPVAVRSSATAEDLSEASFAGQQETILNVRGINELLRAIKQVYASLFTARAVAYRAHHGIDHAQVGISVGIQEMVRSDKGVSGVMFTLDTESGFNQVVFINASYGLGETLVQGQVNPDEFYVHKPLLKKNKFSVLRRHLGKKNIKMVYGQRKQKVRTVKVNKRDQEKFCISDAEIQELARQGVAIEKHYGKPMDIEWAKDGIKGEIYIVQARPETVKNLTSHEQSIERFCLDKKGEIKIKGRSVGQKIGQGSARIIINPNQMNQMQQGEVLVTEMTDPDWEPIMKLASAIVTDRGGRTCHAAIVARELGIPAVVGCGSATTQIENGEEITVSCAEGETGIVYEGLLPFHIKKISVKNMPKLPFKLCLNLGNPDKAFTYQFLPNNGVGLARLEFIISNTIGIHPNALLNFEELPKKLQQEIQGKIRAYASPIEFYIEKLREGIATIAAAFYPKEVIFRFSDFKSNEYANLLGGKLYEPTEENPMIGYRGASRYIGDSFKACFALECEAFKRVRDTMGLTNAQVMIPFVRTVEEIKDVIASATEYGLIRGKNALKIYMMCEVPSNALLAEEFLEYVDGFSIGSNDLTQLTLGLDRDSDLVASLFDERNAAVKKLLHKAIIACNKAGKYIGICGQGPSDHTDLAKWLMDEKIQAISLSPDTIIETWLLLGKKSKEQKSLTDAMINPRNDTEDGPATHVA
jgi:pyruvate,water dikinase